MISASEMENCATTRTFLGVLAPLPILNAPFKNFDGTETRQVEGRVAAGDKAGEDRKCPGGVPKRPGWDQGKYHGLAGEHAKPEGSEKAARRIARTKAMAASRMDSPRNWAMSWLRSEPRVFRMPTSFARCSLRAVERFMKLMQASNRTKMPDDADEPDEADGAGFRTAVGVVIMQIQLFERHDPVGFGGIFDEGRTDILYPGCGLFRGCPAGQADIDIAAVGSQNPCLFISHLQLSIGNGGEDLDIMKGAVGGRVGKDPADGKRGLVPSLNVLPTAFSVCHRARWRWSWR